MKKTMKCRTLHFLMIFSSILMSGCQKNDALLVDWKKWFLDCPIFATKASEEPFLARAGAVTITVSDYQSMVHRTPNVVNLSPEGRRQILDQLLHQRILVEFAKKSGVKLPEESRLDLENMEYNFFLLAFLKKIPVTDQELNAFYLLHGKELYAQDIVFSHVLVKSLDLAQRAQALLKKGRPVPGLLRDILTGANRNHIAPFDIVKTVSALHPGQVSEPVKTIDGYEVIRRERSSSVSTPPFESVKEQIRYRVAYKQLYDMVQQELAVSKPQIDEKLLNSLELTPPNRTN